MATLDKSKSLAHTVANNRSRRTAQRHCSKKRWQPWPSSKWRLDKSKRMGQDKHNDKRDNHNTGGNYHDR